MNELDRGGAAADGQQKSIVNPLVMRCALCRLPGYAA
jgi:hypothetical protein